MDPFETMERSEEANNFELHDFIEDPNFDQFINLIRGDNDLDSVTNLDFDYLKGCFVDNQFGAPPPPVTVVNNFDFDHHHHHSFIDENQFLGVDNNSLPSFNGDDNMAASFPMDENDGEDSSGTTVQPTMRQAKGDRSRTLVSERRRRGRMKEKLYALRALVPNITKMDKASIVGDAVLYVQELQMKGNKLKTEIASLEASLAKSESYENSVKSPNKITRTTRTNQMSKMIMKMDAFQVEERGFYLRLECNKGEGVAISLYKAMESLTGFNVHNSNLATLSDKLAIQQELVINLPNLKLWVTAALMNQGFALIAPLSPS
ncbi:hypothetical protein ACFE04_007011 [Oxalis oulophora]